MTDPRFSQAEQHYQALKAQRATGQLTDEAFERALWDAMFESHGRWWMLGANTGRWYASDGESWTETDPPTSPVPPHAGGTAPQPVASPNASATSPESADRSAVAQILRLMFLAGIGYLIFISLRGTVDAWNSGDPGGSVIIGLFALLLIAAVLAGLLGGGHRS